MTATAWPTVAWLDNGCTGLLLAPDVVVFAAHCGSAVSAAWFGDVLDVSVDADAGTVHVADSASARKVRTLFCAVHPSFELGTSTDVGFCRLEAQAAAADQIVHPAQGCAASVTSGADATLVGFGRDSVLDPPGTKRTTSARVLTVTPSFTIGDSAHGTCAGDSGSPAFVRVGGERETEWAVAGILSAGPEDQACGVGYYVSLAAALPWLERTSGVDLSPCFDDNGAWAPSAGCTRPNLDELGLPSSAQVALDELCGAPFSSNTRSLGSGADAGCSIAAACSPNGLARCCFALAVLVGAGRVRARRRAAR